MTRVIPKIWVDMKTGELTREAMLYLNDLDNNKDTGITTIGTRLSGVALKTDGIIAGTVALEGVTIAQRGSLTDELDSLSANVGAVSSAASGSGLTASFAPPIASGYSTVPGAVTTNAIVVTASGGTSPYSYAWSLDSGDTFTINSPSADTTTFSVSLATGQSASGIYKCVVTDDVAATFTVYVSVSGQVQGTSSGGGIIP